MLNRINEPNEKYEKFVGVDTVYMVYNNPVLKMYEILEFSIRELDLHGIYVYKNDNGFTSLHFDNVHLTKNDALNDAIRANYDRIDSLKAQINHHDENVSKLYKLQDQIGRNN